MIANINFQATRLRLLVLHADSDVSYRKVDDVAALGCFRVGSAKGRLAELVFWRNTQLHLGMLNHLHLPNHQGLPSSSAQSNKHQHSVKQEVSFPKTVTMACSSFLFTGVLKPFPSSSSTSQHLHNSIRNVLLARAAHGTEAWDCNHLVCTKGQISL